MTLRPSLLLRTSAKSSSTAFGEYALWLRKCGKDALRTGCDPITNGVVILPRGASEVDPLRLQSARSVFLAELIASRREPVDPPLPTGSCAEQVALGLESGRWSVGLVIPARTTGFGKIGANRRLRLGGSVGQGHPWHGGQRATYEDTTHQPQGLTAREAAAGKPASELVEVAVGSFLAHLCPLSPKGGPHTVRSNVPIHPTS
jgi:hypothetical protein